MRALLTLVFISTATLAGLTQGVGIGTSTPETDLHLRVTANSAAPLFMIENGHATGDASMILSGGTSHYAFGVDGSDLGKLKISLSSTGLTNNSLWTLTKTGLLGIGTSNPTSTLHVAGRTRTDSLQLTTGAATGRILVSDANGNALWQNPGAVMNNVWKTSGNTASASTFFGTTNDVPLKGRVNNKRALLVDHQECNVTLGYQAGDSIVLGDATDNTLVGHKAGLELATGDFNVLMGFNAGWKIVDGSRNTAVGAYALSGNVSGQRNTAVGFFAASNLKGEFNISVGDEAGAGLTGGDQSHNISIGNDTQKRLLFANWNVAVGDSAGWANRTATGNTFLGHKAGLGYNTPTGPASPDSSTGAYNTFVGFEAGRVYTSGSHNVFIGHFAGGDSASTGSNNILIGDSVQLSTPDVDDFLNIGNTIYGKMGIKRVGIGIEEPTKTLHVGDLGTSDGVYIEGGAGTSQVRVFLDNNASGGHSYILQSAATGTPLGGGKFAIRDEDASANRFVIDSLGMTGIGTNNPGTLLQVGENGDGSEAVANAWNTFSDIRFKTDIETVADPLDIVQALRGVRYTWKSNDQKTVGFIAQETEKVLPEVVNTNAEGFKSMDYARIVPVLVEAIKAQQEMIEALQTKLDKLSIQN